MDLYCQKCGEPWDSAECWASERKVKCENWPWGAASACDHGTIYLRHVEPVDPDEDGLTGCGYELTGCGYERSGEDCEKCAGSGRQPDPDCGCLPEDLADPDHGCTESCDTCDGDGHVVIEDTCEDCGAEIPDSYYEVCCEARP